jgi:hypothetical protein
MICICFLSIVRFIFVILLWFAVRYHQLKSKKKKIFSVFSGMQSWNNFLRWSVDLKFKVMTYRWSERNCLVNGCRITMVPCNISGGWIRAVQKGISGARRCGKESGELGRPRVSRKRRLDDIACGRGLRGVSPPIELEVCTNSKWWFRKKNIVTSNLFLGGGGGGGVVGYIKK